MTTVVEQPVRTRPAEPRRTRKRPARVVLQVFLSEAELVTEIQTAVLFLLIGIAMISSLLGVSRTAVRYHRRQDYRESYPDDPAYGYEPRGQYGGPRDQYEPRRYR